MGTDPRRRRRRSRPDEKRDEPCDRLHRRVPRPWRPLGPLFGQPLPRPRVSSHVRGTRCPRLRLTGGPVEALAGLLSEEKARSEAFGLGLRAEGSRPLRALDGPPDHPGPRPTVGRLWIPWTVTSSRGRTEPACFGLGMGKRYKSDRDRCSHLGVLWSGQRPPEPCAEVRILPRALIGSGRDRRVDGPASRPARAAGARGTSATG